MVLCVFVVYEGKCGLVKFYVVQWSFVLVLVELSVVVFVEPCDWMVLGLVHVSYV